MSDGLDVPTHCYTKLVSYASDKQNPQVLYDFNV